MKALLAYLSGLTVSQGRLAGQPFAVLPWQRRFVRGAFAPGTQSAALSVGRGNGKTALLSGIAAATLDGPLAVQRGETVLVASSFEQARISFEFVLAFLGPRIADKRQFQIWDTRHNKAGSNRAPVVPACAALVVIRAGRTGWRRFWCLPTSRRNGRTQRASAWLPRCARRPAATT